MSLLCVLSLLLPLSAASGGADREVTLTEHPDSTEADSSALEDELFEDEAWDDDEGPNAADSSHAEPSAFTSADSTSSPVDSIPDTAAPAEEKLWAVAASMTGYFGTSRDPYAVPVLGIEYQGLYMEARYNYEDFETGSIFLGWHFGIGDEYFGADITPLFGAVFGQTDGVAPALLFDMSTGRFMLGNEVEYVVLSEASSESFVYSHSELSYRFPVGLSIGIVGEHSKTQGTSETDYLPGFLVGMEGHQLDVVFYLFQPGDEEALGAIELEFGF
jgi:hypothetical protein